MRTRNASCLNQLLKIRTANMPEILFIIWAQKPIMHVTYNFQLTLERYPCNITSFVKRIMVIRTLSVRNFQCRNNIEI